MGEPGRGRRGGGIFAFWSGVVVHRFGRLHLAGRLVFAQADETRVTQIPIRRAFGIGDFGDEARLDPFRVPRGLPRRVRERRGLAGERPQLARDFGQTRLVEAGSDSAAVAQLPVFEFAEQQRGERPLFLGGGPPAADDEFVASRAFRLDPPRRAPRDIGLVGPLRHDAFEPHSAGLLQDFAPVADYVVAVEDDVGSIAQQRREPPLALDQRKAGEILSIELQKIEGVISERFSAAVERALQPPKIGAAVFVQGRPPRRRSARRAPAIARRPRRRREIFRSNRDRSGCRVWRSPPPWRPARDSRRTLSHAATRAPTAA